MGLRYADDPEADYFIVKELEPGFLARVKGVYHDPEAILWMKQRQRPLISNFRPR